MKRFHCRFSTLCLVVYYILNSPALHAQSRDERAIVQLLNEQIVNWNRGDIDAFMIGYWNNDSLMFIGKNGVTYGYQNTVNNYKRNYSDTTQMGKLSFDIIKVQRLSKEYYYVVGKWFLKRTIGDIGGHYTLLFRKIKGKWQIIADHTS